MATTAAAATAAATGATRPPTIVSASLLAEYRFDDGTGQVLTDHSGNGKHGQLGTSSGAEAADPAWVTEGLSFTSGDQVALKGGHNATPYAGTPVFLAPLTAWTVQFVHNGAAQSNACIYAERSLGADADPLLFIGSQTTSNTDRPRIWLRNAAAVNIFQTIPIITAFDGAWHFVSVRRNDTSLIVTVDDVEIGNTVATGTQSVDANIVIGASFAGTTQANPFVGSIAWLATYNAALTEQQVQQNRAYVADLVSGRGIVL